MIGSHDTYTFLRARRWWFRPLAFAWRTQTKDMRQQYRAGVRYLDVRVRRDGDRWRVCHGVVDLDLTFRTLDEITHTLRTFQLRILLERGDASRFEEEAAVVSQCDNVRFVAVKKGWRVLCNRDLPIVDLTFTPFLSANTLRQNVKRLFSLLYENWRQCSIKGWAKAHPLPEGAENSDIVYFKDMI